VTTFPVSYIVIMGDNSTNCNRFDPRFMDIGYGHFDYTMGNSDKKKA